MVPSATDGVLFDPVIEKAIKAPLECALKIQM